MRTTKIIINKELNSAFNSWSTYIGYLLFFCICGFVNWISSSNIFNVGQASMMPFFIVINWTAFFMIHVLSMRTVADEKRNGTLELLFTKPIKANQLIGGKFLSQLILIIIAFCLTIPYYLTIIGLGHIDLGPVILGYIGLICISACYTSIGIFASSLSRTAAAAFLLSLGIGLCFQLLFGILARQIGSGWLAEFFMYLSIEEHFDSLSRGVLDSRDIIYFISLIVLFLSLSKVFICKTRY
ncbi:ABC transporter permease [Odoribacter lunatus]|uniref:ABC transporter permease n=1 Tax=Odoribacter lunatus TaxID=2941335 RepID=UPI00203DD3AF|nr:ABC transporter permease subunit [Odoribacter lunatus]